MHARDRMSRFRARQHAAGLRLVQFWAPDVRRPDFVEECRRQALHLRDDPREAEVLAFIEQVADWDERAPR